MPAFAASPSIPVSGHITSVVKADVKTGRLVRATVILPRLAGEPAPPKVSSPEMDDLIERVAMEQGVEAPLVHSVIRAESNYNPEAISPKGAMGMMQLIPATARRFGVSNAFDAKDNVEGGVRYLRFLLDYYNGDYPKAIAAYNAGEAAVDRFNGIPPYPETRNYVWQVAKNLKSAREKQAKAPPKQVATAQPAKASPETPRPVRTSVGSDGRVYYSTP